MTRAHRILAIGARFACLALFAAGAASAASDVTVDDSRVFPESITATADGTVIFGSMSKPIIYKADPGSTKAEPWIHLTGNGAINTLGVLADRHTNTLWACQQERDLSLSKPPSHTALRAFDLQSGAAKGSYPLPGESTLCNDIALEHGGAVYISDSPNGRIFRLKPGADALELVLQHPDLKGIDGLTFVKGVLYVNSISANTIMRVPLAADGTSAGPPVQITLSRPIGHPDGLRAQGDRLFVAENGAGRVSELVLDGDKATVVTLKDGFDTPTAVQPRGDILWVGEAKLEYLHDPKLKDQDPGVFKAYALSIPPAH
jgi:sugar lactone lactonase YvrE